MLDKEYFDKFLFEQVRELGSGCCTVTVVLTDGTEYNLVKPPKPQQGYVMMEVFPQEGVTEETKAKRRKPDTHGPAAHEVYYDRIAVPYECILRVFLTVVKPESTEAIGYNASAR